MNMTRTSIFKVYGNGIAKTLLIVAFMLCMQTINAQEDLDAKYATELPKAGTVAPDFTLSSLDGNTISLSDFKGKYVVLDFWASWCPDCIHDIPEIQSPNKIRDIETAIRILFFTRDSCISVPSFPSSMELIPLKALFSETVNVMLSVFPR